MNKRIKNFEKELQKKLKKDNAIIVESKKSKWAIVAKPYYTVF